VTLAPAADTIFGRIVTGDDVEQWCLDCLKKWSPTYLSELERQHGVVAGTYQRVRQWVTAPSMDKWPEDQLPAVLLISVGLAEPPAKRGDGTYRARWQMGVACIVSAATPEDAHAMGMLYIAAHRTILVQRPSLEGQAQGIVWQDENYDDLVYDDTRTLAAGSAQFTVEVDGVVTTGAGPLMPSEPHQPTTDPYPPWAKAETVEVEVEHVADPQTKGE
jgi:hypothetical protein